MMNLSSEITEFKARNLLEESPVSLVENSYGFDIRNEELGTSHGPFETRLKALEVMAKLWDQDVESSRTGFIRRERVYHGSHGEDGRPVISCKLGGTHEPNINAPVHAVFSPEESLKVRNHCPLGLDWNNKHGGAAQLALALLLEHYRKEVALKYYHRFKRAVIWSLPRDGWILSEREIWEWMEQSLIEDLGN